MAKAASTTARSKILQKLQKKAKGAYSRAKEVEAKAKGFVDLPGNIDGVARLTAWTLGEDKKGNPFFQLKAVVKTPEKYKGKPIFLSHFISETQNKTVEDKITALCNDIKLLGGDLESTDDIEEVCPVLDKLCEDMPYFEFNTWRPKEGNNGQEPRTIIFPQGVIEDFDDDDVAGDATQNDEPAADDDEPAADDETTADETPDEEWEPAKGDVYNYKSNPRAKAQECEVTAVNKTKKTVTLKRCSDKTAFKDVAWDRLESVE